jgi:hypothetical protein
LAASSGSALLARLEHFKHLDHILHLPKPISHARAGCVPRIASSIRSGAGPIGLAHTHDEEWPLTPGEPVELDIEIWPTSIVVPPGYRIALTVRGKDYEYDGTDAGLPNAPYPTLFQLGRVRARACARYGV